MYLKEFDLNQEKDEFNLAYIFKHLTTKMQQEYQEIMEAKRKEQGEEGEALSRDMMG